IISADSRGDIIYFNKGAEEMFGYSALEIKNKPLPILMPERLRQFHKRGFNSFLSNGKPKIIGKTIELAGLKKNGNEFPIELSLAHWQVDKKSFFTAIIRDITDRKTLEERKDDFISIAAHELKSPVATIKAMNEILLEILDDNQRAKKYLAGTKHEVARLTKLVNDLLNVSRIQAGNLELYKSKFSLQRLIKEVTDNMRVTTKKHKIFTKGKINRKVFADREWIRQVLINLLSNAIKFSPKKGKIVVDLKDNSDKIVVSVTDYGIGIQKDHQDKIFNRFYRIHNHNTNKAYPGLGIGLYLSQQITKLHQGEIWVKSTKGQGSTFYFSLPYK
ncbi:MAG: PAS domain-containing sensor histidine kinase, partial [Candidatus Levybacteria bacterium]|nr:PAS domain-containing sensor histidine kinase [Candidatus Levybacteria bacterium]